MEFDTVNFIEVKTAQSFLGNYNPTEDMDLCNYYFDKNGLGFENGKMPFLPLPYLIATHTYDALGQKFSQLGALLEKIICLYKAEREVRGYFGLPEKYDRIIRIEQEYIPRIQYCRFDFTFEK